MIKFEETYYFEGGSMSFTLAIVIMSMVLVTSDRHLGLELCDYNRIRHDLLSRLMHY